MAINRRLQTSSSEDIGNAIKTAREAIGLTQSELGDKVGVAKTTICKWEQGRTQKFSRSSIAALSKALCVSPARILGWGDNLSTAQIAVEAEILNPGHITTRKNGKEFTNLIDVNYIVHNKKDQLFIDIDQIEKLKATKPNEGITETIPSIFNDDKILSELVNVYQRLSIREQMNLLSYAYELEETKN